MAAFFELLNDVLIPRLTGAAEPDIRVLTLADAAEATGATQDALRECYYRFLCGIMPAAEASAEAKSKRAKPARTIKDAQALKLLKQVRYASLSQENFDLMLAECERRGLSVWCKHTWAEMRHNDIKGLPELFIGTTADGLRAIAERTGQYQGVSCRQWCGEDGVWVEAWLDEDSHPSAARVAVRRAGCPDTPPLVARWKTYAPYTTGKREEKELPPHWVKMDDLMLAKCALVLAIRDAFPELGGIYAREEMEQMKPGPRPSGPSQSPGSSAANDRPGEDVPHTPLLWHIEMMGLGVKDERKRNQIWQSFRMQYQEMPEDDFCAMVYRSVRDNPEQYGLATGS